MTERPDIGSHRARHGDAVGAQRVKFDDTRAREVRREAQGLLREDRPARNRSGTPQSAHAPEVPSAVGAFRGADHGPRRGRLHRTV